MTWTVVKVGGSLYDWPLLGERLRAWLAALDADRVLLVPGGGPTANAIRTLDQTHRLGEEAAHWLAIQALSVNARFLQALLPEASLLDSLAGAPGSERWRVLDAWPFYLADEANNDHLPHQWSVTSDSLAVRAAVLLEARELILLKSVSWDGTDWAAASAAGVVDAYFPQASTRSMRVGVVNLRRGSMFIFS
jgi:aspartokinase-like uncharacterized kinase